MLDRMLLAAGGEEKLYVEDVFSTYLYTGDYTAKTITNGIDLSGKGGLVWTKDRSLGQTHRLVDTANGGGKYLISSAAGAAATFAASGLTDVVFYNNGYKYSNDSTMSAPDNMVSWTFRKAPKFFDVVTWNGNGAYGRTISHNLGVAPGCIIIKHTSGPYASGNNWVVWHRSDPANVLALNTTGAAVSGSNKVLAAGVTATSFQLGGDSTVNREDGTYVAYLFAHDTSSTGFIQCGSFTTDGSGNATVDLGWEPQWVLIKQSNATSNWFTFDTMRGMSVAGNSLSLAPNAAAAEANQGAGTVYPTATGFVLSPGFVNPSGTFIYIAIRRGPMKTPTVGTSVFAPVSQAGGGTITTNFPVDLVLTAQNTLVGDKYSFDRLRGSVSTSSKYLITNKTDAEATVGAGFGLDNNLGYKDNGIFSASYNAIYWNFRRAPGFFDEVCYTGTGAARTVNHNLGVAPELMIVKARTATGGGVNPSWAVYSQATGNTKALFLDQTIAGVTSINYWNNTTPTSSVFSTGAADATNASSTPYVAYLFASCPGVSKVFSFTGNGSSQTINCGFSGGARFVMIKRTDSAGDWYVWDTARGLVTGNDPHLSLNTTAAEVTTDDTIDPDSTGFIVNQVSATNVNVSGASYIGLAVA